MKYLIYLRVSTEKQSVEMQKQTIFNYLNSKHRDGAYTYELFSDPDVSSGKDILKREGLQQMLKSIQKGDIVVVYKLDRIARDILEMVGTYRKITGELGATVHSLNDPHCDEFSVGLMGVLAQKERSDIRTRTRNALKTKKANGERYSGQLPYGYTLHETHMVPIKVGDQIVFKKGVLVQAKTEQAAIELMRECQAAGSSYGEIAKILDNRGYKNRQGKPFQKMTVYRILSREATSHQLQEAK